MLVWLQAATAVLTAIGAGRYFFRYAKTKDRGSLIGAFCFLLPCVIFTILALITAARALETPIRGQFLMKWEYVEIEKAENGDVGEMGDRKAQTAAGGEGLGVNQQAPGRYTQSLYVIEVGSTKAKFRLSDDKDEANQEAVVESGTTQDIWLAGHRAGIRIRIESISPIKK